MEAVFVSLRSQGQSAPREVKTQVTVKQPVLRDGYLAGVFITAKSTTTALLW